MLDLKEESKAQSDQRGLLDSLTEGHRHKDKEDAKEREEGNAEWQMKRALNRDSFMMNQYA